MIWHVWTTKGPAVLPALLATPSSAANRDRPTPVLEAHCVRSPRLPDDRLSPYDLDGKNGLAKGPLSASATSLRAQDECGESMNAVEIEEAVSKLAEAPFDAASFPYAFLEAFGNKDTTIKRLRGGNTNQSDLPGGVLQRNNIHIKTCADGEVTATLSALRESPGTVKQKAKFILATDGKTIEAERLIDGETLACEFIKLPDRFTFFLPLAGITTVRQIEENAFDIRATGRLNKLYIELLKENPDWDTEQRREDLNHFFARLIFCFFAEDTGIFHGQGLFTATIEQMTEHNGSNTHEVLSELFRAMNTRGQDRAAGNFRPSANQFPYVNGNLFSGSTDTPRFSRIARSYLLHNGRLDWKLINPDIFGSMIQAVADDEERGALGMHYTSVPNILKVLNPLFLDELRAKLEESGDGKTPGSARKLLNLRDRLARIRVFDPACGSGNFLVIAYKEMRGIEGEINRRRRESDRPTIIPLTNFRGIELRHFAAEVARLALIIAEYQCDVLYRGEKLALAEFLPLDKENWITCGNALTLDWNKLCPPRGTGVRIENTEGRLFPEKLDQAEIDFENAGGETYVCGNPPYLGGKKQSESQKEEMKAVASRRFNHKNLDYICAFFAKAVDHMSAFSGVAFVATSSINQGIHVPVFWPFVLRAGVAITFGYEPFKWSNNAANKAGVYCTIIGLSKEPVGRSRHIHSDEGKREVANINPYLIPGGNDIVVGRSLPVSDLSPINTGNQASDGGNLFVTDDERREFILAYPEARQLLRRVSGTSEFFDGTVRWCLWIGTTDLVNAEQIEPVKARIERVREFRKQAGDVAQTLVNRPHQFRYRNTTERMGMIVPQVSSESRQYIPAGIFDPSLIITHKAHAIFEPTLIDFAVFNSKLHFVWAKTLSGRLGNGLSYSSNLSWNTLPVPALSESIKTELTRRAEEILLARENHFPTTIAELYDPEQMPDDLRAAHDRNDETLERIYIGRRFKNDTERLEVLFDLYTKMTANQDSPKKPTRRKAKGSGT